MTYRHGVYGAQSPTTDTLPPSGVSTLPVYIGSAPVHLLSDALSTIINTPILINSFEDAKSKLGYSDDWEKYSLCEAVHAHFKNKIQPIGPIILINVLDQEIHKEAATASVTLTNGQGYITDAVILPSIEIEGKTLGTHYTVELVAENKVLIKEKTEGALTSPVAVNYDKVDTTKITNADVIGEKDSEGNRTGLYCIELIYQMYNMIPTILAAPWYSQIPEIKEAMIEKSIKVNGHWNLTVNADIDSTSDVNTIAKAKEWKDDNGYIDTNLKVFWPKAKSVDRIYWLSTLATVRMQQTDYKNNNIPSESPSNKPIDCTATVLKDGDVIQFDEVEANELNAHGITTVNFRTGIRVLWGPHNANYEYGKEVDIRDKFDCSIRSQLFLINSFQNRYMNDVDSGLNRAQKDTILNDCQTWLNSLVRDGHFLYAQIEFNESSNPTSSMVEGDFVFDIRNTTTPPGKSLTFKVQYTTKGLYNLFGGEV